MGTKDRIRIAFLDYSHVFAGAERMLYNVLSHIDSSKYEPYLIFPYPMEHQHRYDDLKCEKIYLSDGLKWWMGSDKWKHPLRGTDFLKRSVFGGRIAKVIRDKQIDILDINLMRTDVLMWVWATRKFTDAKIVGHYRSQEQEFVPPAYAQKQFDLVACVSGFSKMRFQLKGKFVRAEVLYDSVDVDIMNSSLSKKEAKKRLGYSEDTILLTSVGQLYKHKGHDTAIKAFARIYKDFPNARLLIAGGAGGSAAAELAEYYRSIADELGISDKVSVPGKQFENVQDVYRASDLTLSLTKVGEGFGLVPYESTLIGTPFIAPKIGAVLEFVDDGTTGLLVDTNDLDAVEHKMRYALEHTKELAKMCERLQVIIHNKLTPEILSENLCQLYHYVCIK